MQKDLINLWEKILKLLIKNNLYKLLKIRPSVKDTITTINNLIPKEKLKLLEIYQDGKKYVFKDCMNFYYEDMYSKYSLKGTNFFLQKLLKIIKD